LKLAKKFLEMFSQDSDEIKEAFTKRLNALKFEGIIVDDVSTDLGGDTVITFAETGKDAGEIEALFTYDEEEGAIAVMLEDGDPDPDGDGEVSIVDFDSLNPVVIDLGSGQKAIDLVNIDWMNESAFSALFLAGEDFADEIEEAKVTVIRGGKKVRLALVRKKRKKRLTPKQKQGIRKGVMKRRAKKGQISRKRKKSLKIRKRMNVKGNKNKRLKAAGTGGHL
jgi:hypothetical protein